MARQIRRMQELLTDKQIYTISSLNKNVRSLIESHFKLIWVEGEISNLSRPSSGHLYFTLKDENAQVRCAIFRLRHFSQPIPLENGMHILACAKISLYEARGDYQLIIEQIEERGEGILRRQFEQLKNKLHQEGLFDLGHKKRLPLFPKCIGVITSPSGAAIRDVLCVLNRRFPNIPVIIYPTQVQGESAPPQIKHAIELANSRDECDVIILCRGGGSLEDLWCFNDELVARAIFQTDIPIVSGIGHEVDFTIADFVADQRAPTPSAAAELVTPDRLDYLAGINHLKQRLHQLTLTIIQHKSQKIEHLKTYFCKPERLLLNYSQMLDLLEEQLNRCTQNKLQKIGQQLNLISVKLQHLSPLAKLSNQKELLSNYLKTMTLLITQKLRVTKQTLITASRMLNTVSPLQTLDRGYSIATSGKEVIDSIQKVHLQDAITVEVKDGYFDCVVKDIKARSVSS